MSMLPFFPSLKPSIVNGIWFNVHAPCDEEAQLRELEKEHHEAVWEIAQMASDLQPIGKAPALLGPETDEEDNNDDSDDSDSHDNDEDEDEFDALHSNQLNTEQQNGDRIDQQ